MTHVVSKQKTAYEIQVCLEFRCVLQAEDGIRDSSVTGVQTCALPILCKPGDQLQEKSDVCACQQGLFHQVLSHVLLGVQILIFYIKCKLSTKCFKLRFSDFLCCCLVSCVVTLKSIYYYNYRSPISLQVAKLAKSAGVQILIFPTVYISMQIR